MNAKDRERLFVELFNEYRERIMRLCRGYVDSPADAEDLFQEIMTRVWDGLPGFRGEARPSTWLYRIAVNSALLYRRRKVPSVPLGEIADSGAAAPDKIEKQELRTALHRAIAALREPDRLIASLLLEGLSYKDIAEITGLSVNYVGVKISRIKHALEGSLRDFRHGRV